MELLSDKEIKNLPVEGKDGAKIGRVINFEVEPESQAILNYIVKPKQVVKGILEGNLVISREQVIEINKYKIVVDDTVLSSQPKTEAAALTN